MCSSERADWISFAATAALISRAAEGRVYGRAGGKRQLGVIPGRAGGARPESRCKLGISVWIPGPALALSRNDSQASARRQHHHHLAALEAGFHLDLGDLADVVLDAVEQPCAELLVGHFAAAEPQRHLDLVALFE